MRTNIGALWRRQRSAVVKLVPMPSTDDIGTSLTTAYVRWHFQGVSMLHWDIYAAICVYIPMRHWRARPPYYCTSYSTTTVQHLQSVVVLFAVLFPGGKANLWQCSSVPQREGEPSALPYTTLCISKRCTVQYLYCTSFEIHIVVYR